MSKKYKGKLCAYCGLNESSGPDHVIARQFFPKGQRPDIPKVPACDICNGRKSDLETYFTALLPFGSNHPSAQTVLIEDVAKRLDKNRKLARELKFLAGYSWGESDKDILWNFQLMRHCLMNYFLSSARGYYFIITQCESTILIL